MRSEDREQFDAQVATLCAAYNVPLGDRPAAMWQAFEKISLSEFARMVEYAMGESGPEKFPTVKQLWNIRRDLRAKGATSGPAGDNTDTMKKLVEHAISLRLTDKQRAAIWSWVATKDQIILGLIIPECDGTAHRIMAASLHKAHDDFL